jgi:hypothetical protein
VDRKPKGEHAFIFKISVINILPQVFKGLYQVVDLHVEDVLQSRIHQIEQEN